MMTDELLINFYKKKIAEYASTLSKANRVRTRIAWLRLLVFLFTFILVYSTWSAMPVWVLVCEIAFGTGIFLFLVSKDTDKKNESVHLQRLIEINRKEINILNNDFSEYDTGLLYLPPHHAYAEDLDIFGTSSLYQYINRCTSEGGQKLLGNRLLYALPKEAITTEQQAVKELKNKTDFRQQLAAFGAANHLTQSAEKNIITWLKTNMPYQQHKWNKLTIIYPFFTIASLLLWLINIIPGGLFSFIFLCFMLFAFSFSKKISPVYDLLSQAVKETETCYQQLRLIESEIFTSEKWIHLQQQLRSENKQSASVEIARLDAILNRFNLRLNTLAFFFINTFLLWDLRQIIALNKWKAKNENGVQHWFAGIAEAEYSSSLATLFFNQPQWTMPKISDDFFSLQGSNIGHPLLPQTVCVTNSFSLKGRGKIAIITGSNMGGKSTFLRSVGVNIVLALMGAPVCAESFSVSYNKLMTSMRVADNLAESTSTFYAELKKLKSIIEAVNNKEPVFILLDEILRGTNSLDRHSGSVALLKQMIQKDAVAVIATHDVELAKLEQHFPQAISNYHFDVQANEDELYFDYKLKEGICTSMNASILMKNIGIEML